MEYLTADQVLAEVEAFCENSGTQQIAKEVRAYYEKHGVIVHAAMISLKLEKVVLYRRKDVPNVDTTGN